MKGYQNSFEQSSLSVIGGTPLEGEVAISGAKNSVLPILAASLMLSGKTRLHNVPHLKDVTVMLRMLNALGVRAEFNHSDGVTIWNEKKVRHLAPYDLVTAMRASFFVAGPILACRGYAKIPLPGGCSIGARPVDIHLKGFEALGAKVDIEHGFVGLKADRLVGTRIPLSFPSVGATENLLMAASLAEGETVIENAAIEPEVMDLMNFLNKGGAKIQFEAPNAFRIQGVSGLKGIDEYHVIPDRIEAGTFLVAGALTGGDIRLTGVHSQDLGSVLALLRQAGVHLDVEDTSIRVKGGTPLMAVDFETEPFPGFPTDMQAQMMSLLCVATGKSRIKESIFENRYRHVTELSKMGADISVDGQDTIVTGVPELNGASVTMSDLRAGAALVISALAATGESTIFGLSHLMRGYCDFPGKLAQLGARIIPR